MVPSGIKVKDRILSSTMFSSDLTNKGEANRDYNTDKYACSLSKMIEYWRQTWSERTKGITDIQFPFGVVQVGSNQNH